MAYWSRNQVSYCNCAELQYTHAHCPCNCCQGKDISRSTEYHHWQQAQGLLSLHDACNDNLLCIIETQVMPTHDLSSAASSSLNHQPICTEPENNSSNDDVASWSNSHFSITTAMENEDSCPLFGQNVESDVVVAVMRAITLL